MSRRLQEAFAELAAVREDNSSDGAEAQQRAGRDEFERHLMTAFFDAVSREDFAGRCRPLDAVEAAAQVLVAAAIGAGLDRAEVRMLLERALDNWKAQ